MSDEAVSSGAATIRAVPGLTVQRLSPDGAPTEVARPVPNLGRIPANRKFTQEVAQLIQKRRAAGEKICDLSKEYNCSRHTVQRLCRGRCYPELQA